MAITDISQSVASLGDAHRETMTLITRLRKLEGIGVDAVRAELVQLIHQSLKDSEQDLQLLWIHIEDLPVGDQKTALTSKWHKLSEDTKIARASYRKAQIEAKRNAEAARRQERELLLGKADGKRRLRGANELSQEEVVLNASSDITSSLKRTHTLLSSELSRSQFASETLTQSTQALKELSTRYSTFDDMLLKSRRLITDLVRKNKSDEWYYEKAIYIMIFTIVWLIVRRFLYGPFYLLVWLPLKLCWWMLSLCASIIGVGGSYNPEIYGGADKARAGGEGSIVANKPKVEVKGILEDLPQIPQSSLSTSDVVPKIPEDRRVIVEEKSNYQKHPPPFSPFKESESVLEQVGQAIDKQRRDAKAREHTPVVQAVVQGPRHDEL
ncbi:hypothetical protein L211DRAFT_842263 [Terfezia boudieri ATCC MYA-4762]|uniref:Sec20 C-terminal domain-containing protein n=1 Tax=Terfezia boudieri ATCC MYA-4762 TaxID=1051890 RepID=A0A3N4LAF6_9PEZI|nr:hypothetical protein L211DRAFT_842263 [Terfezia boudieri ATCC MYA-4762]